jgi:hypothetical protein
MLRVLSIRLISLLVLPVLSTAPVQAATTKLDADKIKAGLHTAAPEEDGFVDRALQMVEEGKLSAKTVQSTFIWARQQSRHRFQHFKRGLITRAPNQAVRTDLVTGQAPASAPPSLGERVAARLRRVFSFLPSVHALIK